MLDTVKGEVMVCDLGHVCDVCSELELFHGEFGVCSLLLKFCFKRISWGCKSCDIDHRGRRSLHYEPLNILEFMRPLMQSTATTLLEQFNASELREPYKILSITDTMVRYLYPGTPL